MMLIFCLYPVPTYDAKPLEIGTIIEERFGDHNIWVVMQYSPVRVTDKGIRIEATYELWRIPWAGSGIHFGNWVRDEQELYMENRFRLYGGWLK